jgi:hypothetical protein
VLEPTQGLLAALALATATKGLAAGRAAVPLAAFGTTIPTISTCIFSSWSVHRQAFVATATENIADRPTAVPNLSFASTQHGRVHAEPLI